MTKKVTPRGLRKAQTYLASYTAFSRAPRRRGDTEYLCWAFGNAEQTGGDELDVAFGHLLLKAGVPTLCGNLGMKKTEYRETAQPVRFMLLGFMALYLEDLLAEQKGEW